jgi:hypothetical protein
MANNTDPARLQDLNTVVGTIIGALIGFVAVASLVMLVVGGFRYLSAGDDKASTQAAQKTLTYALGGLIITLSAWVVLNLVGTFLGVNLSAFDICITTSCV